MTREKYFRLQQKRLPRIEGATVTGGSMAMDVSTANRPPRTGVRAIDSKGFEGGDQVLMVAGGDNDAPVILGRSPYIF